MGDTGRVSGSLLSSTLWLCWDALRNRGAQSSHFSREAGNQDCYCKISWFKTRLLGWLGLLCGSSGLANLAAPIVWGSNNSPRMAGDGGSMCVSYLNPQPVPPRTMAATRTAPAMEPMMMLVPLGPREEDGAWLAGPGLENGKARAPPWPAPASPLYLSVSPVGGDVGRGLWILQSLPVQSG